MSIRVRVRKKSLYELSKREQELKDKGLDADLIGRPRPLKQLAVGITEDELHEDELTEK